MMSAFKRYGVPIFLCLFFLFQIAGSAAVAQQTSPSVMLKVARFPYLSYGPIFLAEEEGFLPRKEFR